MSMILDKQQLEEAPRSMREKRIARIWTVLKFVCVFALCLMILAPWLEAALRQVKG